MNEAYLQHAVDCSFVDMVDKNVFVSLRGGRLITGVLRSFDQYFNIVLEDAVERVMHENVYADKELGVQVIRGDSVSLMGECHSRTIDGNPRLRKAPLEEVEKLREEAAAAAALTPAKPGFSMDDF